MLSIAVPLRDAAPWRPAMLAWQAPITALLIACGIRGGMPPELLPALAWLAAATPELVRVDVAEHRLPDRLTLPGYPFALAGIALAALFGEPAPPALATGAAFLGLFLLLNVGGGMGLGDVKLAGLLGLLLGTMGAAVAFAALLLAFVAGGAVAIAVLARRGRAARVPFGPFLLAGFWVAVPLS